MWGVQSVAMERPAHTALFKSIWNHPAEEIGQNVNLGSCAPANYRVVYLVILKSSIVPYEPDSFLFVKNSSTVNKGELS